MSEVCAQKKDRNQQLTHVSRGGGVLFAAESKYMCSQLDLSPITNTLPFIDIVGVKISFDTSTCLFVFVLYITPSVSVNDYQLFLDILSNIEETHNDRVIVLGDFNAPNFCQKSNDSINLVFANVNCNVTRSEHALVIEDDYHPSLDLSFEVIKKPFVNFSTNTDSEQFNFMKANFLLLYQDLLSADWSFLYDIKDVNAACSSFYNALNKVFTKSVPKYRINSNNCRKYPPWFDREIIDSLKYYRSLCKTLITSAYQHYLSNIQHSLSTDPKKLWEYIRKKKGHTRIPGVMYYNDSELSSPSAIINAFNDFFNSVYIASDFSQQCAVTKCFSSTPISVTSISEDEILEALKRSKNSLTAGIDGIPSFILKDCACVLVKPLHVLFNLIIRNSQFPEIWKKASVTPVFKKGDPTLIPNYRAIVLLCNFSKIFESQLNNTVLSINDLLLQISPVLANLYPKSLINKVNRTASLSPYYYCSNLIYSTEYNLSDTVTFTPQAFLQPLGYLKGQT
ncbi:uncharacterized protein LOC135131302 [Zophobas morio]|uniref:uncharacterized protein LOC135131302 n=1 Tax=Zophobas morio TaxID=2755281 RepID=UPI0030835AE9